MRNKISDLLKNVKKFFTFKTLFASKLDKLIQQQQRLQNSLDIILSSPTPFDDYIFVKNLSDNIGKTVEIVLINGQNFRGILEGMRMEYEYTFDVIDARKILYISSGNSSLHIESSAICSINFVKEFDENEKNRTHNCNYRTDEIR